MNFRNASLCLLALAGGFAMMERLAAQESGSAHSGTSLSSVIVYTPRMKSLADFYEKALDLPAPATDLENHIGYWLGDNYLGFEPADAKVRSPGAVSAWFGVGDIDEAYRRMLSHGATGNMEPTPQSWGDIHATVIDPDGNLVGLIQSAEQR